MEKQYDFIAIGDIVADAFIRLKDAHVHSNLDKVKEELCVRFGDKVPYESVEVIYAVGNSANAAVSAARLGLSSALIATVGDDANGKACLDSLVADGVGTEYMKVNSEYPTNYHYVLWYDVERTILVKHAPFPYSLPTNMKAPKWIYLSSMGEHSIDYHAEIATYIASHPETKLAFQPGTFQIKLGVEKLKDIYQRTEIFFCNVEEAQLILKTEEIDKKKLMDMLHALGPKNIVMTDGFNGAYAREEAGVYWFMPIYPHTPVERTGAGDAFESTIAACFAMGKSLDEALLWAPINAMSVTQQIGAQKGLLSKEKLEEYLVRAPENYKPQKI
ncbi:carbohydrate kinase family protein [Candidatus Nomurabacteria bacterium]|jgi:ribokinase|nr:MAG: carbohydrate kinase family protein [Candidatus Nomurabacteria bacterium]